MHDYSIVLGAPSPEMNSIEDIARAAGVPVVYAIAGGSRVHSSNALNADNVSTCADGSPCFEKCKRALWIQCYPATGSDLFSGYFLRSHESEFTTIKELLQKFATGFLGTFFLPE